VRSGVEVGGVHLELQKAGQKHREVVKILGEEGIDQRRVELAANWR
jgi:hypothetical protein